MLANWAEEWLPLRVKWQQVKELKHFDFKRRIKAESRESSKGSGRGGHLEEALSNISSNESMLERESETKNPAVDSARDHAINEFYWSPDLLENEKLHYLSASGGKVKPQVGSSKVLDFLLSYCVPSRCRFNAVKRSFYPAPSKAETARCAVWMRLYFLSNVKLWPVFFFMIKKVAKQRNEPKSVRLVTGNF